MGLQSIINLQNGAVALGTAPTAIIRNGKRQCLAMYSKIPFRSIFAISGHKLSCLSGKSSHEQ